MPENDAKCKTPKNKEHTMHKSLHSTIKHDIDLLCSDPQGRSVGRASNRAAAGYFLQKAGEYGFKPSSQEFDCLDWETAGASLSIGNEVFTVYSSQFSLGCEVVGQLLAASSVTELKNMDISGKILYLHGEIATSPLMPKNFVFYNPDEHKEIIALLEAGNPLAIISATAKDPVLSGAVYPAPMFEDGDFDIPSVYMTVEEGQRLLAHIGKTACLCSSARRIPAKALYVKACQGSGKKGSIILCAHLDTKIGTPGAIDNATGTAILIALMELLQDYQSDFLIEIVPFNGEDYYAASAEMLYLREKDQD
ncbi:MAG: M28 family peptidase, partial [Candidatus Cloacimonadaceae bacterium]|nr:M28 family peptidase [Candidatus Cloacimonadaceae bacterium]